MLPGVCGIVLWVINITGTALAVPLDTFDSAAECRRVSLQRLQQRPRDPAGNLVHYLCLPSGMQPYDAAERIR